MSYYRNNSYWGGLLYQTVERLLGWSQNEFIFILEGTRVEGYQIPPSCMFIAGRFLENREDLEIDSVVYQSALSENLTEVFSPEDFIKGLRRMWIQHPPMPDFLPGGGEDPDVPSVVPIPLPDVFYDGLVDYLICRIRCGRGTSGNWCVRGIVLPESVTASLCIKIAYMLSPPQSFLRVQSLSVEARVGDVVYPTDFDSARFFRLLSEKFYSAVDPFADSPFNR